MTPSWRFFGKARKIGEPRVVVEALIAAPELLGKLCGLAVNALTGKILADAHNISFQHLLGLRIIGDIHHLRKIDQRNGALPVKNVIGRQIAMNPALLQHEIDIPEHLGKERWRFFG